MSVYTQKTKQTAVAWAFPQRTFSEVPELVFRAQQLSSHFCLCSAVEVGTEMLEIDCHLTRDGQVVVSHDNDLRRVTGLNVRISETPFHDLPILKQSLSLDFHQSESVCTAVAVMTSQTSELPCGM